MRTVEFVEWKDPFENEHNNPSMYTSDDDDDSDKWKNYKNNRKIVRTDKSSGPILVSRFGIIPLTEDGIPSRSHNLWMMHTNFDINPEVESIVCKIPGVESFDVFTRYRARISFGKLFSENDVKDEIERILTTEKIPESKIIHNIFLKEIINKAKAKYKVWAVVVLKENNGFKIFSGKDKEEVLKMIESLEIESKVVSWENEDKNEENSDE